MYVYAYNVSINVSTHQSIYLSTNPSYPSTYPTTYQPTIYPYIYILIHIPSNTLSFFLASLTPCMKCQKPQDAHHSIVVSLRKPLTVAIFSDLITKSDLLQQPYTKIMITCKPKMGKQQQQKHLQNSTKKIKNFQINS